MNGAVWAVSRGLRVTVYGIAVAAAVLAISSDADARGKRRRHVNSGGGYTPPYASIVVDTNTGRVLQETNPDSLRHPASLTKIMTLYLLFEQLEAGKVKLGTQFEVSPHAAGQDPSKLGLRPGSSISAEDAIRAIVTKSANDVAVVIAEAIGGDEDDFAALMTKKARALGMSRTVYRNASGLPNDEQVTTARDQATLGRAIQERFPRYFTYFATPSFAFRGQVIRNHNKLVGRVDGVDGIKTGYTHASGFNLVTSMSRNGRRIVGVVLGGRTASARDARMRDMVTEKIAEASPKRTAPMMADADPTPVAAAAKPKPATIALASAGSTSVTLPSRSAPTPNAAPDAAAQGSTEPLQPIKVKTIKVKLSGVHTAALGPPLQTIPVTDEPVATQSVAKPAAKTEAAPIINPRPGVLGVLPAAAATPAPAPISEPVAATSQPATAAVAAVSPPPAPAMPAPAPAPRMVQHSGWIVQVGAFPAEDEAKVRLASAQSKARALLGGADAFTEPVVKGDKKLFRARFAGLDKDQAEAACKQLKRSDIACLTIKN